jgi:multisubunit Na+/H+ antiporter MnhF subunit
VNEWLVAAAAMLALLVPCGYIALRGSEVDRLLGLQLGATITTLAILLLAEGFNRSIYVDLALVYCVLSFTGTLAIVRFLERWV